MATVLASGCFDQLHSGHVAFLQSAAEHGDLVVSLGSDKTISELKNRPPVCSEAERLYMVQAIGCVKRAFIAGGKGILDFDRELREIRPDIFVVNSDGDYAEKAKLCRDLGIEYKVLRREPAPGLPARSSRDLRRRATLPYRIDLAGGWLDQPFVSKVHPGAVLVASVYSEEELEDRSGLATSTRETARSIWGESLPPGRPEENARILFACENPPGTKSISGSQDALGILLPGVNRLYYEGDYWPSEIGTIGEERVLSWLESVLYLKPLGPRPSDYSALEDRSITGAASRALAKAADLAWAAVSARDTEALGAAVQQGFVAQLEMFPRMVNSEIQDRIDTCKEGALGLKLAGAGGGGYLVLISENDVPGCLRVSIRRSSE